MDSYQCHKYFPSTVQVLAKQLSFPQGQHHQGFVLTAARVNARSRWFHPLFFTGDCVCVFKTATNDSLHNVTHCAKSVQDNKKVQTISTSFFFLLAALLHFHCIVCTEAALVGKGATSLEKKKLLKELYEPHYNCKMQKQKDKYKVKVFLHTYQPSIYTKLLQAL